MTPQEAILKNAELVIDKLGSVSELGARFGYNRESVEWVAPRFVLIFSEPHDIKFHPMPDSGHGDETFSVNGAQFSYSDFDGSPCFNNTASRGGPMREGLRVRIAYFGGCIVKLEVATNP